MSVHPEKNIKIISWNARSLGNKIDDFKTNIVEHINPHVLAIQEARLSKNTKIKVKDYQLYVKENTNKCRGLAFFVRTGINQQLISEITTEYHESQTIKLTPTSGNPIYITNIYIGSECKAEEITQIVDSLFKKYPKDHLLTGDFNAKSTHWGNETSDYKGISLEKIIFEKEILVLNAGDHTRYPDQIGHKPSAIDVSLLSMKNSLSNISWQTLHDLLGSDHVPILIETHGSGEWCGSHKPQLRFRTEGADWEPYKHLLWGVDWDGIVKEDIDAFTESFLEKIKMAATETIPNNGAKLGKSAPPKKRIKRVPWWDKLCQDAIRDRKITFKKWKRKGTEETLKHYKIARNKATAIIRRSKKNAWSSFCNNLNLDDQQSKVWKKIRSMQGLKPNLSNAPISDNINNTEAISDKDKANTLGRHYEYISSNNFLEPNFAIIKNVAESEEPEIFTKQDNGDNPINAQFTLREVRKAVLSKSDTAVGNDSVPYSMLKNLPENAQMCMVTLFNQIWNKGIIPQCFKHAIVVPIPKMGKDRREPASYRPISLTSHLGKVLETVINKRLNMHLENNNYYSETQFGFRANKQTLDALVLLETDIKLRQLERKGAVTAVFLDLEKAFDTMWRGGLLRELSLYEINGNMYNYILNFLNNRTFQVKYNGELSETFIQTNGTPQGSVISPTLFNLAVNRLNADVVKPTAVKLAQFADDTAIWQVSLRSKTGEDLEQLVNTTNTTIKFLTNKGFRVNVAKTQVVHFSTKYPINRSLSIGTTNVDFATTAKYLGITLDRKLTYAAHIKDMVERGKRALNLLRHLKGKAWGASAGTLRRIYTATIQSKIMYGQELYDSAKPTTIKKLDSIQYSALKTISGMNGNPSYEALCVLTNCPPLGIERQKAQLCYWGRVNTTRDHPVQKLYNETNKEKPFGIRRGAIAFKGRDHKHPTVVTISNLAKKLGLKESDLVKPPTFGTPWLHSEIKTDTNLTLELKKKRDNELKLKQTTLDYITRRYPGYKQIYTDGSKMGDKVAIGINVQNGTQQCKRISDRTSITTAELMAIKGAMLIISYIAGSHFLILTDSLAATLGLGNSSNKSARFDILSSIEEMHDGLVKQGKNVTVVWIPAHCDIRGNEKADALAKQGLEKKASRSPLLGKTEITSHIKTLVRDKLWEERWKNASTGSYFRNLVPSVKTTVPYESSNLHRLTKLRMHIPAFRFNTRCNSCMNTAITAHHALVDCPDWAIGRVAVIEVLTKLNRAVTVENMISLGNEPELQKVVMEFLAVIDLRF